jgi:hypothetical protein
MSVVAFVVSVHTSFQAMLWPLKRAKLFSKGKRLASQQGYFQVEDSGALGV